MASGLQTWSVTAASNATADASINWAEGQAPSSVNDSARALMAATAEWRDDNNGTLSTTGSTSAFTVTSNQGSTGNIDGHTITVQFHATADTSATLSRDGATGAPIQLVAGTNLAGGEIPAGSVQRFRYSSLSTAWIKQGYTLPDIPVNFLPYTKIQNETDATILGNLQGANWPPQEIALGVGLVLSTTSTSTSQAAFTSTSTSTAIPFTISAPAFPPAGAFKNLSVKVASSTTVTGLADYITLTNSSASVFKTMPASGTVNLATAGSVNNLDTGSLASGTSYAIYAIASSTSTGAGFLASTSFTTPLLPSGYTFAARVGAVATSTSTASTALLGSYQYGRRAQFIVGTGASTTLPLLAGGDSSHGTYSANGTPSWSSVSVSKYVPSTASRISIVVSRTFKGGSGASIQIAPNNSYGSGQDSGGNAPPFDNRAGNLDGIIPVEIMLESSNIYWASSSAGGALQCLGYEDNI